MRNEDLMRLLAGIGGGVALIEAILGFNERNLDSTRIITVVIGIVLAVLVLLAVIRPDNPVPLNWILLVVIGIIMIIFSSLAGGILTLVAGFIGYTEK
ncbi:MAG: hypothetical protein ACFE85_14595 [Candidatus Hodarchaeota archaeon]